MGAVAVALLVAACGGPVLDSRHGGEVLAAELVSFDGGGYATGSVGAISDRPIDPGVFQGWYSTGVADADADTVAARPNTRYVVITGVTGCRNATGAELLRDGDDLFVRFTGGETELTGPSATCVRSFGPIVQFAVSAEAVRGVRTIDGRPPLDPDGPGELTGFVPLGAKPIGPDERPAAQLGTVAADNLREVLRGAGVTNLDQATAALTATIPPGRRGFAFVLIGCAEDGAALIVNHSSLSAKLTGDTTTDCVAPEHFLATFQIDADRLAPNATLGG